MTYATAMTQLASILDSGTSAKVIHTNPPESLGEFPCFVLEWLRGDGVWITPGLTQENATILAALYTTRQILPTSSVAARGYIQEMRNTLASYRDLSNAVFAVLGWRWEGPGAMSYANVELFGIRFEIDVRLVTDP